LKIKKIAIFYQDDAFGRAGLSGFKKAMEEAQPSDRGRGHLRAQPPLAVKTALAQHQEGRPGSGRMVGAYKAVRRIHQTCAQGQLRSGLRQHLLRRCVCACQGTGRRRQGCDRFSQVRAVSWTLRSGDRGPYQRGDQGFTMTKAEPEFVSLEAISSAGLVIAALDKAGALDATVCSSDQDTGKSTSWPDDAFGANETITPLPSSPSSLASADAPTKGDC